MERVGNPAKEEECMRELARWFVEHRRQMTRKDIRPIAAKYFGTGEELTDFYNYLASKEGSEEFGKILRLEAYKAGIAGPPEEKTEGFYMTFSDIASRSGLTVEEVERRVKERQIPVYEGKYVPLEDADKIMEEALKEWKPPEETMFFNVPEARQQLITKGFVYTLRPKMRKTGKDTAYTGSYYKKEKIADVEVEFIKEIRRPEELKEYVLGSGFKTIEDWWKAAEGSRFLFKVSKLAPLEDNVEVYTSEILPEDIARVTGLHPDPKVEYRYTAIYSGPDLSLFQRDLQRLLRERTGIPYLVVDAYYL